MVASDNFLKILFSLFSNLQNISKNFKDFKKTKKPFVGSHVLHTLFTGSKFLFYGFQLIHAQSLSCIDKAQWTLEKNENWILSYNLQILKVFFLLKDIFIRNFNKNIVKK